MKKTVAIVTGAARGIGFAVARRLATDGHRVIAVDVLQDVLDSSVETLRGEGLDVAGLVMDLGDQQSISSCRERLGDDFGRIGILVNNAGISPKIDGRKVPLEQLALSQWELTMRINLTAPFLLSQIVLPVMSANKWGRIISVSSRAARMPSGIAGVDYIVSKTGLIGLTKAIAQDFAPFGITANAVAPGSVESPLLQQNDASALAAGLAKIPAGRYSTAAEIADAIGFLASEQAGYITGATLDVNGGVVMM